MAAAVGRRGRADFSDDSRPRVQTASGEKTRRLRRVRYVRLSTLAEEDSLRSGDGQATVTGQQQTCDVSVNQRQYVAEGGS